VRGGGFGFLFCGFRFLFFFVLFFFCYFVISGRGNIWVFFRLLFCYFSCLWVLFLGMSCVLLDFFCFLSSMRLLFWCCCWGDCVLLRF